MNETGKAALRRAHDPVFIKHYFRGEGIDIGAGSDSLSAYAHAFPFMRRVVAWDKEQGDALYMNGVEDGRYDFVHSSHCLEHLVNPMQAVARWLEIVKPGGYVIITVPDEDLYEKGLWPSRFNADHKFSFTIGKPRGGRLPRSINVLDLVSAMLPVASCERIVLLREFYDEAHPNVDQTMKSPAECAIEIVLCKRAVPTVRSLFEKAIQADNAQVSFAACRQAMELYPYRFDVYHRAMMQALRWKRPEEEKAIWTQAIERLPNEHGPRLYQWLHEALSGRLHEGFRLREATFNRAPWQRRTQVQPPENIPVWTGQPLLGKSITIWSEFGLGDEIFFFRFARILREQCGASHVSVVCQTPLLELFTASGEADTVVDTDHVADLPPSDYWVYPHGILAYLPPELDILPPTVPYLRLPQGEKPGIAAPSGALKVGIVFMKAPNRENSNECSLPSLSVLDSLFDLEGVEFYSLQKGLGADQAAQYAQQRKNFHDLGASLQNMMQTATALADLDMLLTVDTSTAHLAGAMGKPVWVMLPLLCDWRYLYLREDNPYYPTMRLFRNGWGNGRDWSAVIPRIRGELMTLCKERLDKSAS
jgi:SAM-dependent methyltransferase